MTSDSTAELISLTSSLNSMMLPSFALGIVYIFGKRWFDIKQTEVEQKFRQQESGIETSGEDSSQKKGNSINSVGLESGGYIVVDMPDKLQSHFHDLLKGFEEYAQLKGYKINFSIDKTLPGKIAFKFVLIDPGISVSTEKVKQDLTDYINRVQSGEPLDSLPIVIPEEQHQALFLALNNRVSFLQNTYNFQQYAMQIYEKTLEKISKFEFPVAPAPNLYLTGGSSENNTYSLVSSPGAIIRKELYQGEAMSVEKGGIHDLKDVYIGQGANVVGGDLSGQVMSNINALPASSDPRSPGVKELLAQLQEAIEKEFISNPKSKEKALKQLEALTKEAMNPTGNDEVDNATLILRGLSAGAAILTIISKVRSFFGLG
jgi:hypothetical protein